jgi:hypothetical protein
VLCDLSRKLLGGALTALFANSGVGEVDRGGDAIFHGKAVELLDLCKFAIVVQLAVNFLKFCRKVNQKIAS